MTPKPQPDTQMPEFYAGQKVVIELTATNAKTLNEEQRMFAGRCFPDGDYIVPFETRAPSPARDAVMEMMAEALKTEITALPDIDRAMMHVSCQMDRICEALARYSALKEADGKAAE